MTNPIRAALMGALMTLPLATSAPAADNAMAGHDAMAAHANMATMVCRAAQPDEKPTATTADDKKLVCKPVAGMMKSMPAMKPGMTAQQMDDGWQRFIGNVFAISPYAK